jgi:hypothetical protein
MVQDGGSCTLTLWHGDGGYKICHQENNKKLNEKAKSCRHVARQAQASKSQILKARYADTLLGEF